jgi:hypothetical protein
MKTIDQTRQLLHDLSYQFPNGDTTFSACRNSCGEGARGGMECPDCLTKQLGELVGDDLARRHLVAMKVYKSLHNKIIETAQSK